MAKNVNSPTIKTMSTSGASGEKLKLDSQYRLGIATSAIPLTTIAFDIDLKPNNEFRGFDSKTLLSEKTQMASLGIKVDAGVMDIALGVAKNIASREYKNSDWLISGGLGFGFIDLSFFTSTKMQKVNGVNLPSEFGIKLGGGVSF